MVAFGNGCFVGIGPGQGLSYLLQSILVSGPLTPPLAPTLALSRPLNGNVLLRITGAPNSTWDLQHSDSLLEWQSVRPVTLDAESVEIDLGPAGDPTGYWRLVAPEQPPN